MGVGKSLLKAGGKIVVETLTPEAVNLAIKVGADYYDKQKTLVRIPDLKDVLVDEATRILNELDLIVTVAICNPNTAYADESINEIMSSSPRFGTKVEPKSSVKIYYLTQEVIDKSKMLSEKMVQEFMLPRIIGVNIYEAREDLESLGLKITEKIEKADINFSNYEDGQVTKVTYPNNEKIKTKLKTGERVWLYYVDEKVISESRELKLHKDVVSNQNLEAIGDITKNLSKNVFDGVKNSSQSVAKIISNPFSKK